MGLKMLSDEYKGVYEEYIFECSCGEIFKRKLYVVLYKNACKCKKCMNINVYTYDSVKNDLLEQGIELLSEEYKNALAHIKVKYPCGYITERTYNDIRESKYSCPHCNCKGYKRDTEQFYKEVYDLVGDEYTFYGEYINSNTKMKVKHNICGHTYEVSPTKFIHSEQRCPICTKSKTEIRILEYLNKNNIYFEKEKKFKDLTGIGGQSLRFDFCLHNKDNKIFLIEYDGEFHYNPIISEENLERQKEHDRRKNEYCKLHNINLYRIPYWEKDNLIGRLENILKNERIVN